MKYLIFILLGMILTLTAPAQKQTQVRFSSINQLGFLKGNSDQALQVQTVNGIQYQSFFAGIGVGLDYYYERTVPVFLDLRKNLLAAEQTPFLYADFGYSVPWIKDPASEWQRSEYEKGMFYEAGIGYRVPVNRKLFFNFSAGYSQKNLHETRYFYYYRDFPPYTGSGPDNVERFDFTFRRISVKMALGF